VQQRVLELWVMDEHRIGLKPVLRRVFAPRGHRPVVAVHPRYEWLYIYAFAHPSSGRSFYLLMPTVSIAAFNLAVQHFAVFAQPDARKQILLLMDNAAWHTSPRLQRPDHLEFRYLPPYSPELQPAEYLWQCTDTPLLNRCFASLDALEAVLVDHCRWLQDQFHLIRSTTCFAWWPTTV
jgi:hypothetical protein